MSKKEKKKYSLWSNYRFVYSMAWRLNKKTIFYPILHAVLEISTALISVALPAIVVYCLQQRMHMGEIVMALLGSFVLAGLLFAAKSYCVPVGRCFNTTMRAAGPLTDLILKCWKKKKSCK